MRNKSEKQKNAVKEKLRGVPFSNKHKENLSKSLCLIKYHPGRFKKGHSLSVESRKKIGEKNRKNSTGRKHKKEAIEKCRIAKLKEKNPNWKDGITPIYIKITALPEYSKWRKTIFERDEYVCQKCKKKGGELNAHHIEMFSKIIKENNIKKTEDALACKKLWDINNGKTLCRSCHKKEHWEK